jgi:hypothetical protein
MSQPDRAEDKTIQRAKEAGMGDSVMINRESEAAAIHALDMMDPHDLEIGQTFVVTDSGGGTVGERQRVPGLFSRGDRLDHVRDRGA